MPTHRRSSIQLNWFEARQFQAVES
jgi:hypothetical protein